MNAFDTLEYTKGAEKIGIKREHAEYQAQQMARLIHSELLTKHDLKIINQNFKDIKSEFQYGIKDIKTELKDDVRNIRNEIKLLENRLIIKMGSMMLAFSAILIGFMAYFKV